MTATRSFFHKIIYPVRWIRPWIDENLYYYSLWKFCAFKLGNMYVGDIIGNMNVVYIIGGAVLSPPKKSHMRVCNWCIRGKKDPPTSNQKERTSCSMTMLEQSQITNSKNAEFFSWKFEAYVHYDFIPREQFPYIFKQKHRRPLVKDYKGITTRIRLQLSQDIMWK